MITDELVNYIEKKLKQNLSKDTIKDNLIEVGWRDSDIEEGFLKVNQKINQSASINSADYKIDPYRERLNGGQKDVTSLENEPKEDKVITKEQENSFETKNDKDKEEVGKIWIPRAIKPTESSVNQSSKREIEIKREELISKTEEKIEENTNKEPLSFYKEGGVQQTNTKKDTTRVVMEDIKKEKDVEENIPKLIPKNQNTSLPINSTQSLPVTEKISVLSQKNETPPPYGGSLSKSAMISSYSKDVMMASNNLTKTGRKLGKNKVIRFFIVLVSILLLVAIVILIIYLLRDFSAGLNFL